MESISKEKLEEVLRIHLEWVSSGGESGHPAVLDHVDIGPIQFQHRLLSGIQFVSVSWLHADFSGANLERAEMEKVFLDSPNMSGVNFQGAKLSHCYFTEANLTGSNLRGADFLDCSLREALLVGCDFREANMPAIDLTIADLSRANLEKANLTGAWLRGSLFNDTLMVTTVLDRTDLRGADLSRAIVNRSKLEGLLGTESAPFWDEHTKWPSGVVPPAKTNPPLEASTHESGHFMEVNLYGMGVELAGQRPALRIYLDPGNSTALDIATIFLDLDELNRAYGGNGITIRPEETLARARTLETVS